jgi:hypothetical protein
MLEYVDVTDRIVSGPTPSSNLDMPGVPPSLRRRAPARIDITLKSGESPSMTGRKIQIQEGRTFVVQVVPQASTVKVEVAAEPPILTIVHASRIESGPIPTYHAEFSCRLHRRVIPLPTTGKLHVTILDGQPSPRRVTIFFKVWPAYSSYLLWWFLVFLSIVGLRWERTIAREESFANILAVLWADLPHLLGLLALGILTVIPLRFIGWLISLGDSTESD